MTRYPVAEVGCRALRGVLGRYPTGVTVVTAIRDDGSPAGLTVNSFTSLSLDPPLVLWCLRRESASREVFGTAVYFAVNVLGWSQGEIARRFSASSGNRFDGVRWRPGPHGLPLLEGAIAQLICRQNGTFPGGDHLIVTGETEACWATAGPALLFQDGKYGFTRPGPLAQCGRGR